MKLINYQPKRLFAFGCSFAKYFWATWPEIIATDLNIELYNYGNSGAGNIYISNSIAQADAMYDFNEYDLIIVSWTNVCREDRWRDQSWVTPGNIYTQQTYDAEYVKTWADPTGYMIRDLGQIHLTRGLLKEKKCQFHMLQMCDILEHADPLQAYNSNKNYCTLHLSKIYKDIFSSLHPSFLNVLWQNNLQNSKNVQSYDGNFFDPHPTPQEHLTYCKQVFNEHEFKSSTLLEVDRVENNLEKFLEKNTSKEFNLYDISQEEKNKLVTSTRIKENCNTKII